MAGRNHPSCCGYALIELLMAMALSALIVGGMALVLQTQERAYQAQAAAQEELQDLEAAVRELERDLQLAGANLPSETIPALDPGPDDGTTVITIRYLREAPFITKLTAPASDESELFRIPPDAVHHFRKRDQVLVHHDGAWLTFQVEEVGSHVRIGLTPGGGLRRSINDDSLRLVFPQGSEVVRLRDAEVQYVLEEGESGDRVLLRRQGGQERVVAAGLQEVRVEYLLAPAGDGKAVGPQWSVQAPRGTPVLGARFRLAGGRASVAFTVAPRNLSPGPRV
jgi:type II secretory pathway component PulJ